MCLVCGADNPFGLQARFYELEAGAAGATATAARRTAQPPPPAASCSASSPSARSTRATPAGCTAASARRSSTRPSAAPSPSPIPASWGVTAELTLRYRKPLPLTGEVRAVGRITRDTRRLFEGSGEILLEDGSVAVEASGKYLKMALGEITDDDFDQREWFADPRERPDEIDL